MQPDTRDPFPGEQVAVMYYGPAFQFLEFGGMETTEYGLVTSNISAGPSVMP
jgi:hypothetical protein